ncbi:MAG TPA: hypothetical protein VF736_22495 [Pyrinomonadaceae bacterium]|jgi:hypothetical protein
MEKEAADRADVRAAYQSAVDLIIYEGQLSRNTTSVFVQFGILIIAAAVSPLFVDTGSTGLKASVGFILSVVGVVASVMWWSMVARSRRYYEYWIYCASELEQYLPGQVQTFERGYRFARNHEVTFAVKNEGKEHTLSLQFKFIERIHMKNNFHLLYATFTAIFVVLCLINLYRLHRAFS